jgi:hypothetical protein
LSRRPTAVGEAAYALGQDRHLVEQVGAAHGARLLQRDQHGPLGLVDPDLEVVVGVGGDVVVDLGEVGARVAGDQLADRLLGEGLLPRDQGQAGREPLEVPREVADVRLVEVVDVEDQPAVGVEVGPEVLDVEVAVDPDALGAVVGPLVLLLRDVVEEQAGAAAVEGVRVGGHLAVLGAEGRRVGAHQRREGVAQHLDDHGRPVLGGHGQTLGGGV